MEKIHRDWLITIIVSIIASILLYSYLEPYTITKEIDPEIAEILETDVAPTLQKWHQYTITIIFFILITLFFRYIGPKILFKKIEN